MKLWEVHGGRFTITQHGKRLRALIREQGQSPRFSFAMTPNELEALARVASEGLRYEAQYRDELEAKRRAR